ncbi:MAG: 8-oxo-dGTP diphosphatase [Bacillus subtilis]|nr:8-oxo-dGTP diphosphatase [Bacillus subtilis]
MFAYTLGFLRRGDELLMLNRQKKPWKGAWNGVGGKIDASETPLQCIIREIAEETGIRVAAEQVADKGVLTWTNFEAIGTGLHLFLIDLPPDFPYETPIKTREGILDWKSISWICDLENQGVARNIPYFLPTLLHETSRQKYHCEFRGGQLVSVTKELDFREPSEQ